MQDLTPELAASFGLKDGRGGVVVAVEKSGPADVAGLRTGDIVLGANGRRIASSAELLMIVAAMAPGTRTEFDVWRRGAASRLDVTIGELGSHGSSRPLKQARVDRIGLALIELTARERQELETEGSVLVESASGPARSAGIRQGDVMLAVNDVSVNEIAEVSRAVSGIAPGGSVALLVLRDDNRAYVVVRVPDQR
ncbi:MAG: PDZ domain-containing protein [Burkholderiales bacterium]